MKNYSLPVVIHAFFPLKEFFPSYLVELDTIMNFGKNFISNFPSLENLQIRKGEKLLEYRVFYCTVGIIQ